MGQLIPVVTWRIKTDYNQSHADESKDSPVNEILTRWQKHKSADKHSRSQNFVINMSVG